MLLLMMRCYGAAVQMDGTVKFGGAVELEDLGDLAFGIEDLDFRIQSLSNLRRCDDGFDQSLHPQGHLDDPFAIQFKSSLQ